MAKNKELKKETIKRLGDLITKHGYDTKIDLTASEKYASLYDNYMNAFEKKNADIIIDNVYKGFSFDEIKLLLKNDKEEETVKKNNVESATKIEEKKSPMEEATESVFMISQQKVVDIDGVEVIIGEEKSEGGDAVKLEDTIEVIEETANELKDDAEPIFMASEGKVVDVDKAGKVVDTDVPEGKKSKGNQGETTTGVEKKPATSALWDDIKVAFDTSPLGVFFAFIGAKPVPVETAKES